MNRRGFALLTVLWVVAALSGMVGATLALARTGVNASRNRITLTRAAWAREACAEIVLGQYHHDSVVRGVDTTDLGRGAWCRAELSNTGAKLDLNHASPAALGSVLQNDTLLDALLDWRDADDIARPLGTEAEWYRNAQRRVPRNGPLADVGELTLVRGFDSSRVAQLTRLLSTDGTEQLDINAAPPELLATLPGLTAEAVEALLSWRSNGQRIEGAEQLIALLSPAARETLLQHYQEFTRQVVYTEPRITAVVEGGVRGALPTAIAVLTLVPAAQRLAVVERRTE
jgi:general secretion pathway protein K